MGGPNLGGRGCRGARAGGRLEYGRELVEAVVALLGDPQEEVRLCRAVQREHVAGHHAHSRGAATPTERVAARPADVHPHPWSQRPQRGKVPLFGGGMHAARRCGERHNVKALWRRAAARGQEKAANNARQQPHERNGSSDHLTEGRQLHTAAMQAQRQLRGSLRSGAWPGLGRAASCATNLWS